jgi:hypothetical protein
MVTVHRLGNFRFVIFSNDHDPAHIHIVGPGSEAKVQLAGTNGLTLIWQHGFHPAEMRKVMVEVALRREMLLQRWNDIHG